MIRQDICRKTVQNLQLKLRTRVTIVRLVVMQFVGIRLTRMSGWNLTVNVCVMSWSAMDGTEIGTNQRTDDDQQVR